MNNHSSQVARPSLLINGIDFNKILDDEKATLRNRITIKFICWNDYRYDFSLFEQPLVTSRWNDDRVIAFEYALRAMLNSKLS